MDEIDFLENASASFTDIEQNGSPTMPLPFDQPQVGRAIRVDAPVYNPHTQDVLKVSNIVYEHHMDGRPPERAYWVGRKLKKCIRETFDKILTTHLHFAEYHKLNHLQQGDPHTISDLLQIRGL